MKLLHRLPLSTSSHADRTIKILSRRTSSPRHSSCWNIVYWILLDLLVCLKGSFCSLFCIHSLGRREVLESDGHRTTSHVYLGYILVVDRYSIYMMYFCSVNLIRLYPFLPTHRRPRWTQQSNLNGRAPISDTNGSLLLFTPVRGRILAMQLDARC